VLQFDGVEVFKQRVDDARVVLPLTWRFRGQARRLESGYYRWLVWPLDRQGRKSDRAVVVSALRVE
jgi:hypothetical protein